MSIYNFLLTVGLVLSVAAVLGRSFQFEDAVVLGSTDCKHQGKQNNYVFGQSSFRDRVLFTDKVSLKSKLLRTNSVDVTYPRPGSASFGTITKIEVTDLRKDGTGGCVYLANGGPGQRSATLHFTTQSNHGLDFLVIGYGN